MKIVQRENSISLQFNANKHVLPWLVRSCWYWVTAVGKARVAAVAAAL